MKNDCWKDIGTDVIVAEPPAGSCDLLEKLCEEYRMKPALHNHQKTKQARRLLAP